ncbi:MAG TPA: NAD-dependent deacylase [Casimicrobiaceae bacterium]|nr:NAD-dependent deacylase [Casimicrobiaceae bacterium]
MSTPAALSFDPALLSALGEARLVAALTGAGISAASRIPTFRDPDGLWARFDPRELATPSAFARDPKRVWNWYARRRERVAAAQPNAGHFALAQLERRVPAFAPITQNVDGLHQRAGSRNVIELHGNIMRVKCSREGRTIERWEEIAPEVPRCPACGALLRPDVVWFEELLPESVLGAAEDAAERCDVMLVVGTSAEAYPAAALPPSAKAAGAAVVEINPRPTPLSGEADFILAGPAGRGALGAGGADALARASASFRAVRAPSATALRV